MAVIVLCATLGAYLFTYRVVGVDEKQPSGAQSPDRETVTTQAPSTLSDDERLPLDSPVAAKATEPVVRRVGLHVTEQELQIWRSRAQNGPYRVQGDAGFENSPADWMRIVDRKNSRLAREVDSWERTDSQSGLGRLHHQ